jgi:hypothetical protein
MSDSRSATLGMEMDFEGDVGEIIGEKLVPIIYIISFNSVTIITRML